MHELAIGEKVRFKRSKDETWSNATYIGVEKDGSLTLIDEHSGGFVCIHRWKIQYKVAGPRGGLKWLPLEKPKWD